MATTIDVKKYCRDEAIWTTDNLGTSYNCSELLDSDKVRNELRTKCDNTTHCTINTHNVLDMTSVKTKDDGVCGREAFFYA
jgi:hypothetical protein